MNPEFRRQLTLELTPSRLVLMPAVLALLAVCVWMLEGTSPIRFIHQGALAVMGLLAACVGTFTALSSINDELNERTWDQQRMSAMGPWAMAWGKLLGGPSYAWYGSVLCAAVALVCAQLLGRLAETLLWVALSFMGACALHCCLMASRLYGMDPSKPVGNRSTWGLVVLVFILLQAAGNLLFGLSHWVSQGTQGNWWGVHLSASQLLVLLSVTSLLLGLLALWRAMSMQLSVPTTPWAWVLGNVAVCAVAVGLVPDNTARILVVLLLLSLSTYYAAALEGQVAQRWRTLFYSARHGLWRRFWQNMPLWPVSWSLAFIVLLPAYIVWNAQPLATTNQLGPFALMWLMHVLRDCGVYLFFALRNNPRSPFGMTMLVLLVLGGILPAIFWSSGLAPLFEPFYDIFDKGFMHGMTAKTPSLGWLAWVGMGLQLVVLAAALVWRFKLITPTADQAQWP